VGDRARLSRSDLLIYGATGYSGRLIAAAARRRGRRPILAARNAGLLHQVGQTLGLETRPFALDEPRRIDRALDGVAAVLHTAGPFASTAAPMVEACLRNGVHYLDLTAEIDVFEALRRHGEEARACGVVLLPGVGHAVVASDCLAVHTAARVPNASVLRLAIGGLAQLSRGSTRALVSHAGEPVRVREHGRLRALDGPSRERRFDFGNGPRPALSVGWADLATAYHSTRIPNIETYFEAIPMLRAMLVANRVFASLLRSPFARAAMLAQCELLPEGPDADERAARRSVIVAEVEDPDGHRAESRLFTPEVYASTAEAAVAVADRVLAGAVASGFQTPGGALGGDFVLSLPGVIRQDLAAPTPRRSATHGPRADLASRPLP
jgi:short subunit dehydrogenase-like uncharacterized protein